MTTDGLIRCQRKDLRKMGYWTADSCSGVPYDPEEYITLKPTTTYELVEDKN